MRFQEESNLQGQKVQWRLPGAEGGDEELLSNGHRVSVLLEEKS